MLKRGDTYLRLLLVLAGLGVLVIGANVGFGGIPTLGLQIDRGYVEAVDEMAFAEQDSHVRFLGLAFVGVGLFFILGATHLRRYAGALYLALALMFIGGLVRLSTPDAAVLFGPVLGSLLAEIVLPPVLGYWLWQTTRTNPLSLPRRR